MTTQGIQEWKVPVNGRYTIDAYGGGTSTGGIIPESFRDSTNGGSSGAGVDGNGTIIQSQAGQKEALSFVNGSTDSYSINGPLGFGGGGYIGGTSGPGDIGGQGGTSYILSSATNILKLQEEMMHINMVV